MIVKPIWLAQAKENIVAERSEENRRYNTPVGDLAKEEAKDIEDTAKKVPAHEGETKTTTSTEGSAETTTTEKK